MAGWRSAATGSNIMTRRTGPLFALALLMPPLLMLAWMAVLDQQWRVVNWLSGSTFGAWMTLALCTLAGVACLMRLNWSRSARMALIAVYAPLMMMLLFYGFLVGSCVIYHDCI